MYQRVHDVRKRTRPVLKKYERVLAGKSVTGPEYKRMTNAQSCGCLARAGISESAIATRGGVDQRIRYHIWYFGEKIQSRK